MSNLLDGIPSQPQRQDSAIAQLYDLVRVANRLGMHDAADAIKKVPHVDGRGSAFVYLCRGKGTLYVLEAGTLHPFWLLPGYVATFDDTLSHFWLSATPCTLLAGNYRT